jgi:hypothetical protein
MNSRIVLHLPARPGHPRNSEGAFVTLRDDRILFAYSHYVGDDWGDHARAVIAARESADGGRTWSADDRILVAQEGDCNVMSVSLLRLHDGRVALFYLRKNSTADCRLHLRSSTDEGASWSEPVCCNPPPGYFVTHNDRVVQLASGRLIAPASFHRPSHGGETAFFFSGDAGHTWREGPQRLQVSADIASGLQEPGVIERRDGSLYGWARTDTGRQWEFASTDGGATWSTPRPSRFAAPLSPLSIRNLGSPAAPLWLAVWNNPASPPVGETVWGKNSSWGRTPLVAAWSHDEGATWSAPLMIEDDPARGFCYTAIHRTGDAVLLAYCCGGRGTAVLQDLCIRRLTDFIP